MKFFAFAIASSLALLASADKRISLLDVQNEHYYKSYQTGSIYAKVEADEPNFHFSNYSLKMENDKKIHILEPINPKDWEHPVGTIFPIFTFETFTKDMDSTNGINTVSLTYLQEDASTKKKTHVTSGSKLTVDTNSPYSPTQNEFCSGVTVLPKPVNVVVPKEEQQPEKKDAEVEAAADKEAKEEVASEEEKSEDCSDCKENAAFGAAHLGKATLAAIGIVACLFAL